MTGEGNGISDIGQGRSPVDDVTYFSKQNIPVVTAAAVY